MAAWLIFAPPLTGSESTARSPSANAIRPLGSSTTAASSAPTAFARARVPGAAVAEPPPGVSAEQWAQLRSEMAQRQDGEAELERLAAYFSFADSARRFRELRQRNTGSPSTANNTSTELATLALELDEALPERLRQRELTAGEARLLKAAIVEVQVADLGERAQRMQQWQQSLPGTVLPAAVTNANQAEFLRKQQALVAAWSAQPAALRDSRSLEQQLESLRRNSFPNPTQ